MLRSLSSRAMTTAGVLAAAGALATAGPAGADRSQTIKCIGNADFCGATVSLTGGASNRPVTIQLTDTDFTLVGVRVIPATSKGAYDISHATFLLGGSEYRFTLNAVSSNPKRARIILLFAAGSRA